MKLYRSIPGPSKAPHAPCVAFDKLDGSNIRAEWNRKRGWSKFGTRHLLLDATHPDFGSAVGLFQNTYADSIERVFLDNKEFRSIQQATVYFEFFGPSSFAGYHNPAEPKEVVLFDVEIYKRGFMIPRDFIKFFGHLKIPAVVYEGNMGKQFVQDVREGRYPVTLEGVVCKGTLPGGHPQHSLWMAKIKTKAWLDALKARAEQDANFAKLLEEEQVQQE